MTKAEAINAMLNGSKVTHRYFQDDEFIYMESGKIFCESDHELFQFWELRSHAGWESNWSIYRMSESEKMWVESF